VRMTAGKPGKIALLWRGDRQARREATAQNNRYNRIFEELAALGIEAEPAVYARRWQMKCGRNCSVATACSSGSIQFRMDKIESRSMRCCATLHRVACG